MQSGGRGVTFQEFPEAQFASSQPVTEETESFHGFGYVFYSVRIREAQSSSNAENAARAQKRASKLRRAVKTDLMLNWQTRDEDVLRIVDDGEIRTRQEPLPMPPPLLVRRNEKVVRFSDDVETEQLHVFPTEPCELCSAHELCLSVFVSRVASAKDSVNAVNASDAIDRGLWLQRELQANEEIDSDDVNAIREEEPWLVIEASSNDNLVGEASRAESKACGSKRKCFWILDTRCVPEAFRNTCEGKRWQDQVRQSTSIF
eukprot:TRINITY_DN8129_c0_g2_i1.p1 TRINITY_DN8129_c0_g2~~TRINITY_DN8129_c0_g2_i1.p1  ORF type:complete len:260 (+),score=34.61 TRINITY_DN8129_c0_g2_i1:95-874(+)